MSSQSDSGPAPPPLIAVGVIRKPHGVKGEVSVEVWTDPFERLLELTDVVLVSPDGDERREVGIESVREHGGRALIKFDAIDSPEMGGEFRNWTVEVPEGQARALEEDEYFIHDLVGMRVEDADGTLIGTTTEIFEGGGGLLLTIREENGESFDIPFAGSICTVVDVPNKLMKVELPQGLRELTKIESAPPVSGHSNVRQESLESREESPAAPTLRFDIVTIFPRMFESLLSEGVVARGIKDGRIELKIWDLRDFATDKHRSTDDEAYGGGAGMVMLAEPVIRCVEAIRTSARPHEAGLTPKIIMMSPQGKLLDQKGVVGLYGAGWLVLLCGRYEGFDERIRESIVDLEVSVGDFVVSGGELPAMTLVDAVSRMVEGVVGDRNSVEADSFYNGLLDYPHYTRPAELRGMRVPDVLLSGHAEKIRKWRKEQSLRATASKRPDLLSSAVLDQEARAILEEILRDQEGR
ncbi:MAG TPA: tRNA (guanosine(37)-N1)-methyltransferase TrmD [Thermoanaerobaculia bacterium]|nr:tRNA (guanosine(37)-N1)-methyltransferase TrmD [Thermoanaerobaculia bacterium]